MKCIEIEAKIIEYLEAQLSEEEVREFENHIRQCANCSKELAESKILFTTMKAIQPAKPSKGHSHCFEEMLEREKQILSESSISKIKPLSWKPAFQIAAS